MRTMARVMMAGCLATVAIGGAGRASAADRRRRMSGEEINAVTLRLAQPLAHKRGNRLPLYVWRLMGGAVPDDDAALQTLLRDLDARGIAFITTWNPAASRREKSLATALRIGQAQKKLGLPITVNANQCLHRFFNGSEGTAHVDAAGKAFFDDSFTPRVKIGCPFAVKHRYATIREQVEYFAKAYKQAGLDVDFAFADWEIDGPIEWNGAWAASKKCTRCRKHIPKLDDFATFQTTLRRIRADMQKQCYAEPLKKRFPKILVGNYAYYGHDGWRYWYDWFEKYVEGAPFRADHRAKHRAWPHEFPWTGYTLAMPVVYAWPPSFAWTDFADPSFRWFYFMLKCASNAGRHTPRGVPVITFVSTLGAMGRKADDPAGTMAREKYEDLLWHVLLRGTDALFVYSGQDEYEQELAPVHKVYAASLAYAEILNKGTPICFDTPAKPGPVVSAVRYGNKLLVYRSDFTKDDKPVALEIDGKTVSVPRKTGAPTVMTLE